ncbi:TOMM precursor leader peptide-binding protein [Streptomyces sp. NBC_01341]|uniref:TOMM precursor leader peptide-binding protein n=1 Tax=Streptomyces sp. NBC_01341 TaxID=2903831 RepID=UPI002E0E6269|nr:TOMM precursor leader peptide-binding protein [Streptomyces sp. NBC_01341]
MTRTGGTGTELPVGFKRHLRVEAIEGDAVYLLSEQGTTALQGREVQELAALLDGTRTLSDVLRDAAATLPPATAAGMIAELARADLIGYHDPAADVSTEAYWEFAGIDGASASASFRTTPVELVTLGRTDPAAARAECVAAGLRVTEPGRGEPAALSLVLVDDYLDPRLAEVDAAHRAAGRAWLPAKPSGAETWVGPVFGTGDTACWECLAHRLRGHRTSRAPVLHALGLAGTVQVPEVSFAPVRALGLHTAVLEAAKWVAGMRYDGQRAVCRLDTRTLHIERHRVDRRPQCGVCGDPGLVADRVRRPFRLGSSPKAHTVGGNHRAQSAETVLARYRHLADPVTGIVSGLRPAPDSPDGLNRYVAGRNMALGDSRSLAGLRGGLRGQSGGKGTTPQEAEVGALCEALERYCGTRQGDEPTVRGTLAEFGEAAIHPNLCQLFADRQIRDRASWNAGQSRFQQIPPPFDPKAPCDWTPVWSLTSGTPRLLPTSMLYFGAGPGGVPAAPWADSNGNAAGSSPEDAVVQGFLELVERDAVALWWYNRTRQPAVDLDAFDEPWLARTRQAYARLHRDVWVLDLTADFGIPVMVALSRSTRGPAQGISFGFGAHFDARLALRRAVTEMAQLLPPGGETPQPHSADRHLSAWWREATVNNQPYLCADPAETARTPGSYPYAASTDLREDVECAEILVRKRGMEMLILDQTRPDVGLPVAKVIIPGMRHFWARFAPGRLFDTPVKLGRLERAVRYEELNPVPLFV